MITVKLGDASDHPGAQWSDLVREGGNAFMTPEALKAAADTTGAQIVTLAAHDGERLVGFWALRIRRPLPLLPRRLEALPYDYAFLSTPLIASGQSVAVMKAFFAAIAEARQLPKALWLKEFDAEGPYGPALGRLPQTRIKTQDRPITTREAGLKSSGSTRKKLRQSWNRLSALGETQVVNVRTRDAALAGLEIFMRLEAASWKGNNGTAILNSTSDAAFTRRFVGDMAAKGNASVALLEVDGSAIAAQVLLYCGTTAYTWKIAHDDAFSKYSPGALVVDKIAEQLLGADIETIDSCALGGGFMGQLWSARKTTVDVVVSPSPMPTAAYFATSLYQRNYELLRQGRDWYRRTATRRPAKASAEPAAAS